MYWSELGGINSLKANSRIETICSDINGNIYAAGYFSDSTNFAIGHKYVAMWNGISWSELFGPTNIKSFEFIKSLFVDDIHNVYAAGDFKDDLNARFVVKYNTTLNNVNKPFESLSFQMSPNPTNFKTVITFNQEQKNTTLKIIDIAGKEVANFRLQNTTQTQIDISGFENGIYFINVNSEQGKTTQKLIVTK